MRNSILSLVFLLCCGVPVQALSLKDVNYTSADSAQVVQWLEEARDQYVKADRMLFLRVSFWGCHTWQIRWTGIKTKKNWW